MLSKLSIEEKLSCRLRNGGIVGFVRQLGDFFDDLAFDTVGELAPGAPWWYSFSKREILKMSCSWERLDSCNESSIREILRLIVSNCSDNLASNTFVTIFSLDSRKFVERGDRVFDFSIMNLPQFNEDGREGFSIAVTVICYSQQPGL